MTRNSKSTAGAIPKTTKSTEEALCKSKTEETTEDSKITRNAVQEMLKIQMGTVLACFKDTVTFYIIIFRFFFFLMVILYDMISKTSRNPE